MDAESNPTQTSAQPKVFRLIRPSVIVLCGPAACGKSRFAAQHFRPTQIISSDQARALVSDDERDQRFQTQAFALVHCLIEQRLSINRLCVVDSTALTGQARKSLLEIARRHHVPTVAIVIDVPLAACLERDGKRERSVGAATIERQYELFTQAKAAIHDEGFDQVVELADSELDSVRFEIVFRPVPRAAAASARPEPRRFMSRGPRPTAEGTQPREARKASVPDGHPPEASS